MLSIKGPVIRNLTKYHDVQMKYHYQIPINLHQAFNRQLVVRETFVPVCQSARVWVLQFIAGNEVEVTK